MILGRRAGAVVLGAMLLAGTACTPVVNPATGERQYTALSQEDEVSLGRSEHPKVMAEYGGAYRDPALQAYVSEVGNRLASRSELPDLKFTFTLLDSDIVNAFALPGGYVYVTRGLLALPQNEAELAGVLGHEIGHVTARHTAQRVTQGQYAQVGAGLATIAGALLLGETGARLGQQLGGLGAAAWVQGYSREQELEADQLGIRYLARAGYDPHAMATFLDSLRLNDQLQGRLRGSSQEGSGVPSWLQSHPRTEARIEQAANAVEGTTGGDTMLGRERFLAAIDGMVFGDSPEQGFIRGREFLHPILRLGFTAPEGFRLANAPNAVTGQDREGRVMVFDSARAGGGDVAAYLVQEWGSGQRLQNVQRTTVDGGPAAVGFARAAVGGRQGTAMLAAVQGGGGQVYRFVFFTPGDMSRSELAAFERSLESLHTLSQSGLTGLHPRRIEIVTVGQGDTIDSLSRRMEVDELPREWFVVLNRLDRRELRPGEQVKIIRRG
jgi:predicted Zn-dependent protease